MFNTIGDSIGPNAWEYQGPLDELTRRHAIEVQTPLARRHDNRFMQFKMANILTVLEANLANRRYDHKPSFVTKFVCKGQCASPRCICNCGIARFRESSGHSHCALVISDGSKIRIKCLIEGRLKWKYRKHYKWRTPDFSLVLPSKDENQPITKLVAEDEKP